MKTKRMPMAVGAAAALTLTLAACGGNTEDANPAQTPQTTSTPQATGSAEQVDPAHNDADTMFAQMMIVHHEGAIEMADLAVQKAASQEIRTLAEDISAAQGPEIEQMTSWLQAWGEDTTPSGGMGHTDHGGMDMEGMSQEEAMAELEGLSGTEFDRRFLELMIAHHQGAVEMAQTQLTDGENPQALELAQQIIDDQQAEISEMEGLLADLGQAEPTAAQPAGEVTGTVWVANEDGDSLSAIDTETNQVVTTVTGIEAPHNVQVGPDGTIWAVSGSNALVALDPATYELTGTAGTGQAPAHVVLSPDGERVYLTNAGDDTLGVYDAATLEQVATVEVGAGPHGLRPSGDGEVVVVANTEAGTIDVVQTATNQVSASIPVGNSPAQVAVDEGGDYAYVSLSGDSAVAKVDLAEQTVVSSVEVSAPPVQLYLTPDGTRLLSADQGSEQAPGDTVSVIDTETMTVAAGITTGSGPHGVVVDTTGETAWVTNLYDDSISVLDLTTNEAVATVAVGDLPNGISYSPTPPAPGARSITVTVPDYADDQPDSGHDHR